MKASEMKKAQAIKVDGKLYTIIDFEHVKLGKGGAVYQVKMKNIADGLIQNIRVRSEEILEEIELQKKSYEYLYSNASEHVLMDLQTFDQITLNDAVFGDALKYLKPNMQVVIDSYEGKPVLITLPNTVDLMVVDTAPEIKGATAQSQTKPATLETGVVVQVPAFVRQGELIRVDTRTGLYVTRVK
ncbi:MAG: elongation factor P [Phycisphaerae bacterium]|nr:elongation factor P [Phycisphaerae bacterium]MDD5381341.1 elongation factor P [Phycisphaerae bacterium]